MTNNSDEEQYAQNYAVIKALVSKYMTSLTMRSPLQVMRGHTTLLLKEFYGPINAQQKDSLDTIYRSLERHSEDIDVILDTLHFVFARNAKELHVSEFAFSDIVFKLISEISEKTKFLIEHNIPNNLPSLNADYSLIYQAVHYIILLIKQIHPNSEGKIDIQVALSGNYIDAKFATSEGEWLQMDENPELFLIQCIANLHGGKFQVNGQDNGGWIFILMIPIRAEI